MSQAFASLDGQRVISGSVMIPLRGVWTADVVTASPDTVGDRPTLTVGNLVLKGARYRALSYGGSRSVRLVGGAAGWRKTVGPKPYESPIGVLRSTVLGDVASEVGETLQLDGDGVIGPSYERIESPASQVLDAVVSTWFVRPDGVTVIGSRPSAKITSAFTVTAIAGADGRVEVGTEDLASWVPGNTFTPPVLGTELTISTVVHTIADGVVRTEAMVDSGTIDRLRDALAAFVRSVDPRRDYRGIWEYTVVAATPGTSAGGTTVPSIASLRPTDSRAPELVKVTIPLPVAFAGTGALAMTLAPGAKVYIAFANGDPSKPVPVAHVVSV